MAEGAYVLSAVTVFTSSGAGPALTASAVLQITGNAMLFVQKIDGVERRYVATFTTSGASITTIHSYPDVEIETVAYSATPTALRTYSNVASGTIEQAYTKL